MGVYRVVMGDSSSSSGAAGFEGETKNGSTKIFKRRRRRMNEYIAVIKMYFRLTTTQVDSFLCYILVVVEEGRCVGLDKKMREDTAVLLILRSCFDFVTLCTYIFNYFYPHSSPQHTIIWGRILSTIEVLGCLPFPQVMTLSVLPNLKGLRFLSAIRAFVCFMFIQSISNFSLIYIYLKVYGLNTILARVTTEAGALFNLILYGLASHAIGAIWYLLAIERKATCWHGRDPHFVLNCNYGNNTGGIGDNFCNPGAEKQVSKDFHNFGIFTDALDLVRSRNYQTRYLNGLWWGLQKLISLGQDLKTNGSSLDIFFAIFIILSGVLLFALLIGNLQDQLQRGFKTSEKKRLNEESIKKFSKRFQFPEDLKKRIIRHCRTHKVKPDHDIGKLLRNLPDHISVQIKRHICKNSVNEILSKLSNINEKEEKKIHDGIYDRLKPFAYEKHSIIIKKGAVVDELVFKFGGTVYIEDEKDGKRKVREGSSVTSFTKGFWGEELVECALKKHESSTDDLITRSKPTLHAGFEQVKAFVISQKDLEKLLATNEANNNATPDPLSKGITDKIVAAVKKLKNNTATLPTQQSS